MKPNGTDLWDQRYDTDEYVFGTRANDFLQSVMDRIPVGEVLCLADGEGRNGVYLASQGFDVTSVDASPVALEKARRLAKDRQVEIRTELADLTRYDLGESRWPCIVSIFFHMPSEVRQAVHARVASALAPGGMLVLEAYTPKQLEFGTGGPPFADYLMTLDSLSADFPDLEFLHARELEREVVEGTGHTGHAAVVQLLARRNSRPD